MNIITSTASLLWRFLRAIAFLRWAPIPFFGIGLLAVWALWIALAITR